MYKVEEKVMKLDVMGLFGACSYALDCVEAELVHVTHRHAKRVAYMSVCMAEIFEIEKESLQDLTACALLHDNALTQYIQEELKENTDLEDLENESQIEKKADWGNHCALGEENIKALPFHTDVSGVILYHHERADGKGPFGKTWEEVPLFARIIHLCDLVDGFCRVETFTEEIWERVQKFLENARGRQADSVCIDAFCKVFPKAHFLTLGDKELEQRLWKKVPRTKQELTFSQVQALADFFAHIVDYKSPFTSTHSIGVASDAQKLSLFMGFDEETAEKMYLAGALHDIGKVAVGNEILEKPGRLTTEEFSVMKHHAAYSYAILSEVEDFEEIRDWAALHHERLDGTGYPFGKTAKELNTQERIMACVDIYQALTESRPYKAGMSHERACEILREMAEKGWIDTEIVSQIEICFAGKENEEES